MVNIDCIMGLLDWNNPESVQEEGRTLAREVSCINVFIQPCDIMGLLDWNNPESVQEEGRTLAREVSCINVFIQPCDRKYNKNV